MSDSPAPPASRGSSDAALNGRSLGSLAVLYGVVAALVLTARWVVPHVTALYRETLPAHPYFVLEHAPLLYAVMPLVVLAALALVMAPGVLFVLATGGARTLADLVVRGFGATFVIQFAVLTAAKLAAGSMSAGLFLALELAMGVAGLAAVARRLRGGGGIDWPLADAVERSRVSWLVAIPYLCVVLLLPVIFWEDMTDDGFEALEIGRTLAGHVTPRFPRPGGLLGLGIGMVSMGYPIHWFTMLFGPIEAAARLPLALYLPVVFFGLVGLAEWRSPRRLHGLELAAIALSLAAYVASMGYSASYNAYAADLAAPAGFETLTVLCMVGAAFSLWTGRFGYFVCFALLGYFARPTGLLFLGLLGACRFLFEPQSRRQTVLQVGGAIALCLLTLVVYERVYMMILSGGEPLGYSTGGIRERIRYLELFDFSRLLFLIVPCGILPALSLVAFRWQDSMGRTLAALVVAYFLFFFPQAFIALHHFVPAMVLPVALFWRLVLSRDERPWTVPLALALGGLALWLSLPKSFELYRTVRDVGSKLDYRIGNFAGSYDEYRAAIDHFEIIDALFPFAWNVPDASRQFAGAPLGFIYYSTLLAPPAGGINYVVQPVGDPPPTGFSRVGTDREGAAFVRDPELWERDRYRPMDTDYRSALYAIPPETLFAHIGRPAHNYTVDLKQVPLIGRLF